MAAKIAPEEFADAVFSIVAAHDRERYSSVRLGTVRSVSDDTAAVVIAGDTEATPVARFCPAEAGQKALVLKQGTQYYLIGAR